MKTRSVASRWASLVSAVILATNLIVVPTSHAGSGTAADPYVNGVTYYHWAANYPINYIFQDSTSQSIRAGYVNFWHMGNFLTPSIYYVGYQANGTVGSGTQTQGGVNRSAHFSLFPNGTTVPGHRKIIDTLHCGSGADAVNNGVTCSIAYSWSLGTQLRSKVDVIYITYAPWCPTGYSGCNVYVGSIKPSASSGSGTQIGAWSVDPDHFGISTSGYSALELPGYQVPSCTGSQVGRGTFVLPFKNSPSGYGAPTGDYSIQSYDIMENSGSCERWFNNGLSFTIYAK